MLRLRPMTAADVPAGMRLKAQNGWNQLEADWHRLLVLEPGGAFVAEGDGGVIGTAGCTVFGPVAWVSMVLVDKGQRGQGIGTALMRQVLGYLDGRGVRSIRLDATPLGRAVYEKVGFTAEYELTRFEGVLSAGEPVPGVGPVRPEDVDEVRQLDRRVTGTDRGKFLDRLYGEWPETARLVRRGGRAIGFRLARRGARAVLLGPCIAERGAGPLLLDDARHLLAGRPLFIDVPPGNAAATAWARGAGLTEQRLLLRMGRGPRIHEELDELWASSGPEKG